MKRLLLTLFLVSYVTGLLLVFTIDRHFDTFGGDDGRLSYMQLTGQESSSLHQCLVEAKGDKWRPVTSLVNYATFSTLGYNPRGYIILNIAIHSLTAAMLGLCVHLLLNRVYDKKDRLMFPLLGTLFYAGLGFAYYQLTQRFGLMEELGVLFTVCMFCLAVLKPSPGLRIAVVLLLFVLSMLTHERFVSLVAYSSLFCFFTLEGALRKRIIAALVPWGLLGAYLTCKKYILACDLLMGTGGRSIELDPALLLQRTWAAALNLLGYNNGPQFAATYESPRTLYYIALVILTICVLAVLRYSTRLFRDEQGRLVLLYGAALLPLTMAAAVCFRTEFRWLVAPAAAFALWLMALCIYLKSIRVHVSVLGLVAMACTAWLCLAYTQSYQLRKHITRFYFMGWTEDSESMKSCLESLHFTEGKITSVYMMTPAEEWVNKAFIDNSRVKLVSDEDIARMSADQLNELVVITLDGDVRRITAHYALSSQFINRLNALKSPPSMTQK